MDQDGLIEEEAAIAARLQHNTLKSTHRVQDAFHANADERTALLGNPDTPDELLGDTTSSWDGDEDFQGLPWWKRPSVCHNGLQLAMKVLTIVPDLHASPGLCSLLLGIRWSLSTKAESGKGLDLPRLPVRPDVQESECSL